MSAMIDHIMFSDADSEARFSEIIEDAILKGTITRQKSHKPLSSARKRKMEREAAEAEELREQILGKNNTESLESLILSRAKNRHEDMIASLEAKYKPKPKKKKK